MEKKKVITTDNLARYDRNVKKTIDKKIAAIPQAEADAIRTMLSDDAFVIFGKTLDVTPTDSWDYKQYQSNFDGDVSGKTSFEDGDYIKVQYGNGIYLNNYAEFGFSASDSPGSWDQVFVEDMGRVHISLDKNFQIYAKISGAEKFIVTEAKLFGKVYTVACVDPKDFLSLNGVTTIKEAMVSLAAAALLPLAERVAANTAANTALNGKLATLSTSLIGINETLSSI